MNDLIQLRVEEGGLIEDPEEGESNIQITSMEYITDEFIENYVRAWPTWPDWSGYTDLLLHISRSHFYERFENRWRRKNFPWE